mmetsp:Transcript_13004/g.39259  ORF Transcript_13004/g.39259 Transcript_13004/m.39259 type:complete len:416 (-) Transcript_13004:21-1268(-)
MARREDRQCAGGELTSRGTEGTCFLVGGGGGHSRVGLRDLRGSSDEESEEGREAAAAGFLFAAARVVVVVVVAEGRRDFVGEEGGDGVFFDVGVVGLRLVVRGDEEAGGRLFCGGGTHFGAGLVDFDDVALRLLDFDVLTQVGALGREAEAEVEGFFGGALLGGEVGVDFLGGSVGFGEDGLGLCDAFGGGLFAEDVGAPKLFVQDSLHRFLFFQRRLRDFFFARRLLSALADAFFVEALSVARGVLGAFRDLSRQLLQLFLASGVHQSFALLLALHVPASELPRDLLLARLDARLVLGREPLLPFQRPLHLGALLFETRLHQKLLLQRQLRPHRRLRLPLLEDLRPPLRGRVLHVVSYVPFLQRPRLPLRQPRLHVLRRFRFRPLHDADLEGPRLRRARGAARRHRTQRTHLPP